MGNMFCMPRLTKEDTEPGSPSSTTLVDCMARLTIRDMEADSTSSTMLKDQRNKYADDFMGRCIPVDPNDEDLPTYGTFVSPWLSFREEEVVKVYECHICGFRTVAEKDRNGGLEVPDRCRYRSDHEEVDWGRDNTMTFVGAFAVDTTNTKHLEKMASTFIPDPDDWQLPGSGLSPANRAVPFGKTCFQSSLLPTSGPPCFAKCLIHVTWAPYKFISEEYAEYSPDHGGSHVLALAYTKECCWAWRQVRTREEDNNDYYSSDYHHGPAPPFWQVPQEGVNPKIATSSQSLDANQHGGPHSDVWTMKKPELLKIKPILEKSARETNDCPIPRYQMIIDPNQFVRTRKSDQQKVWVPCEFDITEDGQSVSLVGGERAHWMSSGLIDEVATPVLSAALPLLAKLTRPHLLLEGQRMQVVVKAQSITVPKKQEEDDEPEYIGLWHVDGQYEAVAAVVLYYYHVDEALEGGNMEFLDRRPMDVLGYGDTNVSKEFNPGSFKEAFRPQDKGASAIIPNCSVPVDTGTLMVFSNLQHAHRVLRMVNTSQNRAASRKFVALFVLDPAADRLVPARCHLAHSHLYTRALTGSCSVLDGGCFPQSIASLVLEYLGVIPSQGQRRITRNRMLRSQLIPKRHLAGAQSMVWATGNGCQTMIGWIDNLLKSKEPKQSDEDDDEYTFNRAYKRVNALNNPPKTQGRGLSETFSIPSDELNTDDFLETLNHMKQKLDEDATAANDDRQAHVAMNGFALLGQWGQRTV